MDKREDAGEFYPGGAVVPKTPVVPGGGTPADYPTVRTNAATGASHAGTSGNPHGTTAAQVGAAAQTPTFGEAAELANIAGSGEAQETMWGKVKKAIGTLIAHLTDGSAHSALFGNYLTHDAPGEGNGHLEWGEHSLALTSADLAVVGLSCVGLSSSSDITVSGEAEIKRGVSKVVYGVSVNGGTAQHGDVAITIPDVSGKRDKTDNECHATSYSDWTVAWKESSVTDTFNLHQPEFVEGDHYWTWMSDQGNDYNGPGTSSADTEIPQMDGPQGTISASRKVVATSGELFPTRDYADGKVGSFSAVGGVTPTVSNGVANLSTLFTSANTSLMGTIDYQKTTSAAENHAVYVYTVNSASPSIAIPVVGSGVTDFEVWLDAREYATDYEATFTGATILYKDGATLTFEKSAVTVVHFTACNGVGYTAVSAIFKEVA